MTSGTTRSGKWWPRFRSSLRPRVAIAAAIASAVVVAALVVLTSIALAGNESGGLVSFTSVVLSSAASVPPGVRPLFDWLCL